MLLIVSHDAGGAEILSSYVRRHRPECIYVLSGPAVGIFERKIGALDNLDLQSAMQRCTQVLCATSWESDLEWRALRLARAQGKPSAAFLDHWINYRERFIKHGEAVLPDEIWVGDAAAEAHARKVFPENPVRRIENPYFADLQMELAGLAAMPAAVAQKGAALFVDEPIRAYAALSHNDERYWGYTEDDALRYFLSNSGVLGAGITHVVIRLHPSERHRLDKYESIVEEFALPIRISRSESLLADVARCELVVGCESMALVVGLLAGKRVISCVPPGGKPCALPLPEIEHLQTLLSSQQAL